MDEISKQETRTDAAGDAADKLELNRDTLQDLDAPRDGADVRGGAAAEGSRIICVTDFCIPPTIVPRG